MNRRLRFKYWLILIIWDHDIDGRFRVVSQLDDSRAFSVGVLTPRVLDSRKSFVLDDVSALNVDIFLSSGSGVLRKGFTLTDVPSLKFSLPSSFGIRVSNKGFVLDHVSAFDIGFSTSGTTFYVTVFFSTQIPALKNRFFSSGIMVLRNDF